MMSKLAPSLSSVRERRNRNLRVFEGYRSTSNSDLRIPPDKGSTEIKRPIRERDRDRDSEGSRESIMTAIEFP